MFKIKTSKTEMRSFVIPFPLRQWVRQIVRFNVFVPKRVERLPVERVRNKVNAVFCRNSRYFLTAVSTAGVRFAVMNHVDDGVNVPHVAGIAVQDPRLGLTGLARSPDRRRDKAIRRAIRFAGIDLVRDMFKHLRRDVLIVAFIQAYIGPDVEGIAKRHHFLSEVPELLYGRNKIVLEGTRMHVAVVCRVRPAVDHRIVGLASQQLHVIAVAFLLKV